MVDFIFHLSHLGFIVWIAMAVHPWLWGILAVVLRLLF